MENDSTTALLAPTSDLVDALPEALTPCQTKAVIVTVLAWLFDLHPSTATLLAHVVTWLWPGMREA